MAGHGGRRPGAGRPTDAARAEKKSAAGQRLQQFSEKALRDLDALYEAQKDLALGIYYEGCAGCSKELAKCRCKEGPSAVRVYRQPPNQKAGEALISHAKGKAATAQQVNPETSIVVSLGCKRCGGTDPLVPRPPQRKDKNDTEAGDAGDNEPGAGDVDASMEVRD